ncbi:nuclease-related domain-containing protein [Acinetobacter cumulans]|uniref:nuclease-related domain-containing protein n=1 Tax=Acinetobacter cumulans TaxID=2136182 RepID=UPI001390E37C|nr:nuclease-related domain-containing protein [Acinetobacter cumulans]
MLDSFLNQLQLDWATENKWIYIIYNAIWDGQEIDMVCFTEHAIVVADFKNYTGKLGGKENGPWTMLTPSDEMIEVKGGNQLNPFVQIRKNKYVVMEWLNAQQFFSQDNLGFISGAIFFYRTYRG